MTRRKPIQILARMCAALLIVAAITSFYFFFFNKANSTTIALTFLLAILGIAMGSGLPEAIVASVAGVMCLNFFFLPPLFTFYLADTQNWIALFAFLVTAIVVSQLSASVKQRAMEATRQREEVERLYQLSRALMLLETASPTGRQISQEIAAAFEVDGVAVFDRDVDQTYKIGNIPSGFSDIRLKDAALQGTAFQDSRLHLSMLPLTSGKDSAGSLAICGGSVSDTAMHAIANLAAVALERVRAQASATRIEAVRQNEAMKSMLLDALAHEFKTPLTSIKAAASSILDEEGPAQTELRTVIEEETDRLDSLVTETIRMARIEAGDLELQLRPQPIPDLIRSALEKLKILAQDRDIRLQVSAPLSDVLADAELIELTIRQLLTNALKYSDPESPIEVQACQEKAHIKVRIRNSGESIPIREQERIFERYYRMSKTADRVPGTGLGLHIARAIVQAHGGRIGVESEGGNTEFFFTLPVADRIQLEAKTT